MDVTVERIVYDEATSEEDEDKENVNWSNLTKSKGLREVDDVRKVKDDGFKVVGEVRGGLARYLQELLDNKKKQNYSICQICMEGLSFGFCMECNKIEYCETCFKNIHQKGILTSHKLLPHAL